MGFWRILDQIWWDSNQLHGKRLRERRLLFQPSHVYFFCFFSMLCALASFFDPWNSCDELLRFLGAKVFICRRGCSAVGNPSRIYILSRRVLPAVEVCTWHVSCFYIGDQWYQRVPHHQFLYSTPSKVGREDGHTYYCAEPVQSSPSAVWMLHASDSMQKAYSRLKLAPHSNIVLTISERLRSNFDGWNQGEGDSGGERGKPNRLGKTIFCRLIKVKN